MDNLKLVSLFVFTLSFSCNFLTSDARNIRELCPDLYNKPFKGYVPYGNLTAGVYTEVGSGYTINACVIKCCLNEKCNVAFLSNGKCYHISCKSNKLCMPTRSKIDDVPVTMVLVQPTNDETWESLLEPMGVFKDQTENYPSKDNYPLNENSREKTVDDIYRALFSDEAYMDNSGENYCEVGMVGQCHANEICLPVKREFPIGTCECKEGYIRSASKECFQYIKDSAIDALPPLASDITEQIIETTSKKDNDTIPVTKAVLKVVALSKEIKLPANDVTLTATVNDEEDADDTKKYQFEWTLLHQPEKSTAVKHQNGGQLHLEALIEGVYEFKVSASAPTAYGETFVNVTVLPPSRVNKPPIVIITPANQTIKQPNSAAVVDASTSTDDDSIVLYHWELQQGPVGYQPQLKDGPTLQLSDLTKPGNYSFKLTVTDSDGASNSSSANITVLKIQDYPPEANAGEDKVIFLPHNAITLNGNMSTDDHLISTWEWTKSADDAQKAVDMQNTRTPYLKLSNLEEGMYTFILKVTDSADQSSTAQVHVFVKPPTNKPPVAIAGKNVTISLPQTWAILDASNSTDDNKITGFSWEQVNGPSTVTFENKNNSKTNVTNLTKGTYKFKVDVTDDNKNVASDVTYVIVNQNQNEKPTANAGGNFTVNLPINVVIINGSKSKDDWAITKWKWTRDLKSLATGKIAEKSDETPVLYISDVTVGTYIFNLTVFDEQGLSDTDTVTFTVKQNPKLFYLVELTIDIDVNILTEEQYNTIKGKLALLLMDSTKLNVIELKPEAKSGKALISFYVEKTDGSLVSANIVVQHLRQKLNIQEDLLELNIAHLQTAICQNNCSGHGVCDELTRLCICESFWMHNMFNVYLKNEDSDCSWSILYVVIGLAISFTVFVGLSWATVYFCYSWCLKRGVNNKETVYKLIEDTENLPPFSASKRHHISDSDTDSDVVFESSTKSNRFGEFRHKPGRNGFHKMGRKVKT